MGRTSEHFRGEKGQNSAGVQTVSSSCTAEPSDAGCASSAPHREKRTGGALHYTPLHPLSLVHRR